MEGKVLNEIIARTNVKIDINDALKFCGGMDNFMSVAEGFYEMMEDQAEKIKKFAEEKNIREYILNLINFSS